MTDNTAAITQEYDGDILLYCGDIHRDGYQQVSDALESIQDKNKKICLVLITYGGDPDAAYRIAQALNHHYDAVEILIPDVCKSAGTLVCIGAHKLIFGDRGELGPLDVQLSKPDEIFENMSGLDIIQALNALEDQVLTSFQKYLLNIRGSGRLRTKLAADIATTLVDRFISPITAKIDPTTLGEHQRAIKIALEYGERLNDKTQSLKNGALDKLVIGYPSHGFVIDRKEAKTLFNSVERPDESTVELYNIVRKWLVSRLPFLQNSFIVDVLKCQPETKSPLEGETHGLDETDAKKDHPDGDGGI